MPWRQYAFRGSPISVLSKVKEAGVSPPPFSFTWEIAVESLGSMLSRLVRALRDTAARFYARQSCSAGMTSFAKVRSIAMS